MTVSVSMGSNPAYLYRHAEQGGTERERRTAGEYYLRAAEHGEPPGRWVGVGIERLGLSGDVRHEDMDELYAGFKHPVTGDQLGTAPRNYADYHTRLTKLVAAEPEATPERMAALELEAAKSGRQARTHIDVTASPMKDVSVLHTMYVAAGRDHEAEEVWQGLHVAGDAMLGYLMDEAGYSRAGYHGAKVGGRTSNRWVDGHDFIVSAWDHHTSRLGDPQLHTHYAILNRVENADGTYRALDGRAIIEARPAAEAIFHRVLEQELTRRLGVRFQTREDGAARFIVGMDQNLTEAFSGRRRQIKGQVAELAAAYTERYGSAPNALQLKAMAQHATLVTRARKLAHPPTRAEMLAQWEDKAAATIRKDLTSALVDVDKAALRRADRQVSNLEVDRSLVISQAMAEIDRSKSVWNRHDLIGQLDRALPDHLRGLGPADARALLESMADEVLASPAVACLTAPAVVPAPAGLRRESDGRSIYEPHRVENYATTALLNTEERLVQIARTKGGRRLDDVRVNAYLATSSLSPEQANVVRSLVTSDDRIEVLVGPAGAGKSRTMGELSKLWTNSGGQVIGLALSQNAASVLEAEGMTAATNLQQFSVIQRRLNAGRGRRGDHKFAITPDTLVVIDEASMVSTQQLADVVTAAHRAGAKVLVTGDDRQLDAVGAGGAMRLLIREVGSHELSEVRRFNSEWEGAASLRLRDGDVSVLSDYDRHGRLVEGDEDQVKEAVVTAFVSDYLNDKRSVVVTTTNASAAEISGAIRTQLVTLGRVDVDGVELHDGNAAGVGDLVTARLNSPIVDSAGGRVANRDTFEVARRWKSGELTLRRVDSDVTVTLPADYVSENVELAYAGTVHSVQGRTVERAHVRVDDSMNRRDLYVAMTRGRDSNVAFVVSRRKGDDGVAPLESNRLEVLSEVVGRNTTQLSASEYADADVVASQSLARLGPMWSDCIAEDARMRFESATTATLTKDQRQRLAEDDATPALWRLMRSVEQTGHDPAAVLKDAITSRELDSCDSIAQVLHYRVTSRVPNAAVTNGVEQRPRPTFTERTPAPEGLNAAPDEAYGLYARQLATAMDQRRVVLGDAAAREQPAWATQLGPVPEEPMERLDWTERAAAIAAYREQYGYEAESDPIGPAPARNGDPQRQEAWRQAWQALGRPDQERARGGSSDDQLNKTVADYQRKEALAPPWVGNELREAHHSSRYLDQRATLDAERYPDAEATIGTRRLANAAQRRVAMLEEVDSARLVWLDHIGEDRDNAERAKAELERRRLPKPKDKAPETGQLAQEARLRQGPPRAGRVSPERSELRTEAKQSAGDQSVARHRLATETAVVEKSAVEKPTAEKPASPKVTAEPTQPARHAKAEAYSPEALADLVASARAVRERVAEERQRSVEAEAQATAADYERQRVQDVERVQEVDRPERQRGVRLL